MEELLKNLDLKATPRRKHLLDVLAREEKFLSPEEVCDELRKAFPSIGLATVYRNLEELAERGVVTKILHPNRQLYYFLCPNMSHHHHFICLKCRRVEDISVCVVGEVEREVAVYGGTVVSHILQVNGFCASCGGAA